ncbi:MAG TPA: ABC transporter substrate-binding protein [Pyrinomonadaceae bacterium]|nr:ABC transporter substrate-binding protein [Pyrinomonadaceae bacterium]
MKRIIVLIILGVLILPAACVKKPRRIVLGIALSATYHSGVELAIKEINSSGGVGGVPIELMGMDWKVVDEFNATDILKRAGQFSAEKDLIAVIGHSDSASTLSAASFYNQQGIPQIVTIATNPAITNIGDWTYRLCLSDAAQGPALAEYAVKDWSKKRIAIFYVNDDYGRGLAQLFEKHAVELGGKIIASVMFRNKLADDDKALIQAKLNGFKQNEPDLIVLFQRTAGAEWTLRAIRDAKLTSSILGGDSLGPLNFTQAQPSLMQGVRVSQFFLPLSGDAKAGAFLNNFRTSTGKDPDYGHAFGYDAAYLLRDAALYGGLSRDGVKSYLDKMIRDKTQGAGVAGAYTLGSDHDARRELYIVEAHDGAHRLLKTLKVD